MPIDLYHLPASGPCRSVRLVAAAIGVELNLKSTDLFAKEHLEPEFLKMNPQHTIPTIDDNGFYLSESRAICTYLIEQYAKNDSLYPKDPKQRALINQRLYFDLGTLYHSFADYYFEQVFAGAPADPVKYEKIDKAFGFLEQFLDGQNYVAGKNLTVADIILLSTVSNFTVPGFDFSKYKNTIRWFNKVKSELPKYEEINEQGLKEYKALMDRLKKQ